MFTPETHMLYETLLIYLALCANLCVDTVFSVFPRADTGYGSVLIREIIYMILHRYPQTDKIISCSKSKPANVSNQKLDPIQITFPVNCVPISRTHITHNLPDDFE